MAVVLKVVMAVLLSESVVDESVKMMATTEAFWLMISSISLTSLINPNH